MNIKLKKDTVVAMKPKSVKEVKQYKNPDPKLSPNTLDHLQVIAIFNGALNLTRVKEFKQACIIYKAQLN